MIRILAAILLLTSLEAHAGLKESWYMSRGRNNMEIGNYKAAIEAFDKVVNENPNHKEALRSLGVAYEKQGLQDQSVQTFDRYLSKYPEDREIALKQARTLKWNRYSYRKGDSAKYYRAALKQKDDPGVRLELAEILAGDKDTAGEAVGEYNKVLAKDPGNARARKGLAKALAWQGNHDEALYQSEKAVEYGGRDSEMAALQSQLEKHRRPEVGADLKFSSQSGQGVFDLNILEVAALGKKDLSAFWTARVRAGVGKYWTENKNSSGGFVESANEYRIRNQRKLFLNFGYHDLKPVGDGVTGKLEYQMDKDRYRFNLGVERSIRYDSYFSIAGSEDSGQAAGGARQTKIFAEYESEFMGHRLLLNPYFGFVTAAAASTNSFFGGRAAMNFKFSGADSNSYGFEPAAEVYSYKRDHSGFGPSTVEPLAGGYYSPQTFVSAEALGYYQTETSEKVQWFLKAGPSLQYAKDATRSGATLAGRAEVSAEWELDPDLYWKTQVSYQKVANVFSNTEIHTWLFYLF